MWINGTVVTNFSSFVLKHHLPIFPAMRMTWVITFLYSVRTKWRQCVYVYALWVCIYLSFILGAGSTDKNCYLCAAVAEKTILGPTVLSTLCTQEDYSLVWERMHCLQSQWLFPAQLGLPAQRKLCSRAVLLAFCLARPPSTRNLMWWGWAWWLLRWDTPQAPVVLFQG